jgi:hypothetical protein
MTNEWTLLPGVKKAPNVHRTRSRIAAQGKNVVSPNQTLA